MRRVVFARVDLPVGPISADSIELREVPDESVKADALSGVDAAVGRSTLAVIRANEQVVAGKLASIDEHGLAAVIPKGYRAFPVTLDEATVALLRPGIRVDVIWIADPELRVGGATVLQNIRVLSVGGESEQGRVSESSPTDAVTLMLTPDEAQKIAVAQKYGRLRVSIRPENDEVQVPLQRVLDLQNSLGVRPDGTWIEQPVIRKPKPGGGRGVEASDN